ncbi:MAG TPA: nucleoside 2-deoxyribosyltransferase [Methylomirabilota bacterium]|nr:nucleoside 2-deoxyribosyltransferase [Methylomirabilota bacterium]
MKIYLGGPMFMEAEVEYNLRLAKKLRDYDFTVYCPNENTSINDKTRTDITGQKVYLADIEQLEDSNVFICQVAEDSGTMWEAGYMNCLSVHVNPSKYYGVIGLATDIRLQTPPDPQKSGVDNQAVGLNQFVVGGMLLSLGIYLDQETMITRLLEIKNTRED